MKSLKYWWAAFNARPFGMPIPPNWFGIAAFAMLGGFVNPGFWLVGAALEIGYLAALAGNRRFRNVIDVGARREDPVDARYSAMLGRLERRQRELQENLEARTREILRTLEGAPSLAAYSDHLQQLVWLNLRLLNARQAIERVLATARREASALDEQEAQIRRRLEQEALAPDLRRSLEQQVAVIDQRQAAHADAAARGEHIDSELKRIDHQVALIREQALLSRDRDDLGGSLDALAASFNEASRWLDSQRDLIGTLDSPLEQRLPARVLRGEAPRKTSAREGE